MNHINHKQLIVLTASAAVAATLVPAQPAHALFGIGDVVFDPGNFAQHLLILEQHAEQLIRLQQQVQLMEQMLADWDFSRVDETLGRMQQIHGTLDDLAGSLGDLGSRFPDAWDSRDPAASLTPAQRQWRLDRRTRNEQTVELHQQVADSIAQTHDRVQAYVQQSNSAPGQLAAQQATNELIAVQVQQLQDLHLLETALLRAEIELVTAAATALPPIITLPSATPSPHATRPATARRRRLPRSPATPASARTSQASATTPAPRSTAPGSDRATPD